MWWQRPDYHNVGEMFLPKNTLLPVVFWSSLFVPAKHSSAPMEWWSVQVLFVWGTHSLSVGRNALSVGGNVFFQVHVLLFLLFPLPQEWHPPLHFSLSVGCVGPYFFYSSLVCWLTKSSACTNWHNSTETDGSMLTPKPAENLNSSGSRPWSTWTSGTIYCNCFGDVQRYCWSVCKDFFKDLLLATAGCCL